MTPEQKKTAELAVDIGLTVVAGIVIHAAAVAMWGGPPADKEGVDSLLTMPNVITVAGMYGIWKLARHFVWLK